MTPEHSRGAGSERQRLGQSGNEVLDGRRLLRSDPIAAEAELGVAGVVTG